MFFQLNTILSFQCNFSSVIVFLFAFLSAQIYRLCVCLCGDMFFFSFFCWMMKKGLLSFTFVGHTSVLTQPFARKHDTQSFFFSFLCLCCFLQNFFFFLLLPVCTLFQHDFPLAIDELGILSHHFSTERKNFLGLNNFLLQSQEMMRSDIRERKIRMANVTKWTMIQWWK